MFRLLRTKRALGAALTSHDLPVPRYLIVWRLSCLSHVVDCILDTNSNHGTFYYTQLASLQVLVGDNDGAKASIQEYFDGKYKEQIAANGDQVRLARL